MSKTTKVLIVGAIMIVTLIGVALNEAMINQHKKVADAKANPPDLTACTIIEVNHDDNAYDGNIVYKVFCKSK